MLNPRHDFLSLRVLGLGDNVVDRYLHQNVMYPGGNALNFAVYAKLLGAEASFTGTFGTDTGARHIRDVLAELHIPTPHSLVVEGEGGHADVSLVQGNRHFLGSNKGGVARSHPPMLDAAALQTIARQQFVHTSCFSYLADRLADLQAAAPLLGYDISTRWTDAERLARVANAADIVVLSLGERRREQGAVLADALMEHGCQLAIMTMGADGALLWNPAIGFVHIPAEPVQIVDTLGAGDAFATAAILSLLAHGWRRGMTVKEKVLLTAGRFAAGIAAAVCCLDGAFGHGRHID